MTISMYQASVPVIKKMLTNLLAILGKGEAYAQAKGFDGVNLVQYCLTCSSTSPPPITCCARMGLTSVSVIS